MSSKFAALAADVVNASRMLIVYLPEDRYLEDRDGKQAYIDLLAPDSEPARAVDRLLTKAQMRRLRAPRGQQEDEDFIEGQVTKLAAVTAGWYLVAPDGVPIDVPFTKENAQELYSSPEMGWLRRQAWGHHNNEANFIKRSSKSLFPSPSATSTQTEE